MMTALRRAVAPIIRLTTVAEVDHERAFGTFARHVGRALSERAAREEPRVISFPLRMIR